MKLTHHRFYHTAFFWLALAAALQFTACEQDDDACKGSGNKYNDGIFIINEGAFSTGTGTVSFYDRREESTIHQVFELENCEEQLGNVMQSMYVHEGKAYLVVNNANKIVVADADNFEKKGEITGLALPRYFLPISNEKALVSQWGADGLTGSVAVVNLKSLSIEKTLPTGKGAERMLKIDNQIIIANSGGFGRDSTFSIFDLDTETITGKISVGGDNPNSFQVDKNGKLWVICRGHTEDFSDPNSPLNTKGKLVKIELGAPVLSLSLNEGGSNLLIDKAGEQLFYLDGSFGGQIYKFDISQAVIHPTPLVTGFFYSLGYDPVENTLLAGDAKDFASGGEVKVFDLAGSEIRILPAGIIPSNFWVE